MAEGFALYFSRSAIPYYRDQTAEKIYFGHIGLYVYRRTCLLKIAALKPSPLELSESLEQLRALENGIKIRVVHFDTEILAVDVPDDVLKIEKLLQQRAQLPEPQTLASNR